MTVCGNKLSGVCGACQYINLCRNNEIANLPKSNIEWMREASLEELAEFLAYNFDLCGAGCHHCFLANVCLTKAKNGNPLTQEQMIVEWLKQPHSDKE